MLLPVASAATRHLSADAPACQPCPVPVSPPVEPSLRLGYTVADCTRTLTRCQQLAQTHPHWSRSRVRATVARELGVATATLRYLLRKADALGLTGQPEEANVALPSAA